MATAITPETLCFYTHKLPSGSGFAVNGATGDRIFVPKSVTELIEPGEFVMMRLVPNPKQATTDIKWSAIYAWPTEEIDDED